MSAEVPHSIEGSTFSSFSKEQGCRKFWKYLAIGFGAVIFAGLVAHTIFDHPLSKII